MDRELIQFPIDGSLRRLPRCSSCRLQYHNYCDKQAFLISQPTRLEKVAMDPAQLPHTMATAHPLMRRNRMQLLMRNQG